MSWLRSLLLICVMTLVLYGVYAWLVGGSTARPDPPEELAAKGATTEELNIDMGESAEGDPFDGLGNSQISNGANVLPEGEHESAPGSIASMYEETPLPAGDHLYPPPELDGGTAPRLGTQNTAGPDAGTPGASNSAPQSTHDQFQEALVEADGLIRENQLAQAHLALSKWHGNDRLFADDQKQLYDYLDGLAGAVVYSRQHLLEPEYKVQIGDSLETVADAFDVPQELLGKINGVTPGAALTPGTSLKVLRGPFEAEVNLKRMELTLFMPDGRYAGRFNIGVGQEVPPTEGIFSVTEKIIAPDYLQQGVVEVRGGDPNNPFGERLIAAGQGIALHGTNDPQSIGPRPCKEGCIRLGSRDIDDVFDILSVGSQVRIMR